MALLVGLDIGTSNIKAAIYHVAGTCLAHTSQPTPTQTTGLRQAIQDPNALWNAVAAALREVTTAHRNREEIAGVCIASVGEAGVPLDAHGDPAYPVIAWYDERTAPLTAWWRAHRGPESIYAITGLPLGHTFSLFKMQWLRQNAPDAWARTKRWLSVADYVAYRLTGEQAMGYSLASRTMALDLTTLTWSHEMLEAAQMDRGLLPPLLAEGSILGQVRAEASRLTGLPAGTPVIVGGHDHPVGAIALGAVRPGIVLDSTGTTETELMAIPAVRPLLHSHEQRFSVGCHALPGVFYAKGAILGAGNLLRWAADLLFPEVSEEARLPALEQSARAATPNAKGLYLLPHLDGAGSPDRDPLARGVAAGLTTHHTRDDFARAVFEGLAQELRVLWEALETTTGYPIDRIIAAGGGSKSAFWNQLKTDVTGRAIHVSDEPEAVTRGAALLAGLGTAQYANWEEAHRFHHLRARLVNPEPDAAEAYAQLYHQGIERIREASAALGALTGHLWTSQSARNETSTGP